jgi:hypothetical protein
MANFPVFHGITLAANAYVENLNLEILSSDPVPVGAGRLWFNSTDKVVRYSALDSTGAVIVRTIKDAESAATELAAVQASVTAEETRATAAEDAIASDLSDEVTRALAAEAALDAKIDQTKADLLGGIPPAVLDTIKELADALEGNPDIINVLEGMIGDVQSNLDAETTRATAAEDGLASDIADEASARAQAVSDEAAARAAADTALDGRVTTLEGQVNGKIGDLNNLNTSFKGNLVGAINEVNTGLSNEAARAAAAEQAVADDLADEITRAQDAEQGLADDISSEATTRAAADVALGGRIDTEVSDRQAADTALGGRIDTEISDRQAAVSAEATARASADTALGGRIDTEISDRQTAVSAEATARQNADTALSGRIDDEVARATAAENAIAADLSSEVTRATAAENAIAADLADEITRATAAESAEASARAAADTAIRSDYNATVFTFQAGAAATVHTIDHDLNSSFVDVGVQVERANGKYYNDIVSVEEVDSNSVKVYLSTALKVKVICRSAAAL